VKASLDWQERTAASLTLTTQPRSANRNGAPDTFCDVSDHKMRHQGCVGRVKLLKNTKHISNTDAGLTTLYGIVFFAVEGRSLSGSHQERNLYRLSLSEEILCSENADRSLGSPVPRQNRQHFIH
jgi:hypothetical protein